MCQRSKMTDETHHLYIIYITRARIFSIHIERTSTACRNPPRGKLPKCANPTLHLCPLYHPTLWHAGTGKYKIG